jgi:hypothetical protein
MCIVTGLIAGAGTRQLVAGLVLRGAGTPAGIGESSGTSSPGNPGTVTGRPDPSPSTTDTPTSAPGELGAFTLQVQVLPASVSAGQHFTVTATVLAKDHITPLEGVSCTIGAAGNAKLLTVWPAAVVSDARGMAAWTLAAPNVTPGTYDMEVKGTGSSGYWYYTYASITISPA